MENEQIKKPIKVNSLVMHSLIDENGIRSHPEYREQKTLKKVVTHDFDSIIREKISIAFGTVDEKTGDIIPATPISFKDTRLIRKAVLDSIYQVVENLPLMSKFNIEGLVSFQRVPGFEYNKETGKIDSYYKTKTRKLSQNWQPKKEKRYLTVEEEESIKYVIAYGKELYEKAKAQTDKFASDREELKKLYEKEQAEKNNSI